MVSNTEFINAMLEQMGLKDGNDTAGVLNLIITVTDAKPKDVVVKYAKAAKEAVRAMDPHYRKMLPMKKEGKIAAIGLAKMAYVYMVVKGEIELAG